jgi:hypothetical protein
VQGDRDLAGPEVGAEVTTDFTDHIDYVGAHLPGKLLQLCVIETLEVGWSIYPRQEWLARWCLVVFGQLSLA